MITTYYFAIRAFEFKMLQIVSDIHILDLVRNLHNPLRICGFFVGREVWQHALIGVNLHSWISLLFQRESIALPPLKM